MIKALLITLLCVSLLCPFSVGARIQASATKTQQAVKPTFRSKASPDLRMKKDNGRGSDLVRVIIQPASVVAGKDIDTELAGRNVRKFRQLGFRVANLSANAALALAERPEVAHVSLDREVRKEAAFLNDVPDSAFETDGIPAGRRSVLNQNLAGIGQE